MAIWHPGIWNRGIWHGGMWHWLANLYQEQVDEPGKEPLLLLLLGLVVGFVAIRTSTRLIKAQVRWWPGNISVRDVHVHHALVGVLVLLGAGTLGFTVNPAGHARGLLAAAFGVGAGLVLDEFALILHLEDVYWSQEGRRSVDAVIVAVVLAIMLIVGATPFGLSAVRANEIAARWIVVCLVVVNVLLTVITALKGKPWLALLSLSATVVGLIGSIRLAKPGSPWARYRYRDRPDLLARAQRRAEMWERRKLRYITLLAGAHDQPRRRILLPPPSPHRAPERPTLPRVAALRHVPAHRLTRPTRRVLKTPAPHSEPAPRVNPDGR